MDARQLIVMKMRFQPKYLGSYLMAATLFGAVFFLGGCGRESTTATQNGTKTLYTCGMHPQVVQDHPGTCPICDMKLTPIRKGDNPEKMQGGTSEESAITGDPVTTQTMGLRTALVTRGPLRRVIRTVGVVDYDETTLSDVTTKFKGWVEKLYVNASGQLVMRGDPLFEIYSPDLYSAQREYLLALDQGTNNLGLNSLKSSALTKLKFFDISDQQIAELGHTREPRKTLRIVAPQ